MSQDPALSHGRPAPHRRQVGVLARLASLIAGPSAWIVQLVFGYGLSSLSCFPHDVPFRQSPPPGSAAEPLILGVVSGVCLIIAIVAGVVALTHWLRQSNGRARFMAACGILSSCGFALAIMFDFPAILAVPACWSIAS